MTRTIVLSIAITLAVLITAGCMANIVFGSGKIVTQSVSANGFSSVKLATIGNVIITHGDKDSVTIEADDNLIPYFDISVSGTTLTIDFKERYMPVTLRPTQPVRFNVTVEDLQGVALTGSGNISVTDDSRAMNFGVSDSGSGNVSLKDLTAGALDLTLSGSGDTNFGQVTVKDATISLTGSGDTRMQGLKATSVNARLLGSGDITLDSLTADSMVTALTGSGKFNAAGILNNQQVQLMGSGDYRGSELQSRQADVRVTGSGSSYLWVTDLLEAKITGSGDVKYSGKPRVTVSKSGSGSLKQVYQP